MALTGRQAGGYAVNSLTIEAGSTVVTARWKYPYGYTYSITGFKVLWYAYGASGPSRAWVVSSVTVNKDESTQGWWRSTLEPPQSTDAQHIYCWVAPVASGKWGSGPDWQKSATVSSPWVSGQIAAAKGQLQAVSASQDGAKVTIEWTPVNEYQRYVNVYRRLNGATDWKLYKSLVKASAGVWSEWLADGSNARYALRAVLGDKKTLGALTSVEGGARFDGKPLACSSLKAQALTSESMKLTWKNAGHVGASYDFEWSYDGNAWKNGQRDIISEETWTVSSATAFTIGGLDSGKRWYARMRRSNDTGSSEWADLVSTVLATRPTAPTMGTLPTSVAVDGSFVASWTHNSEDGSDQSAYELVVNGTTYSGTTATTRTLRPSTLGVGDGGTVTVKVRTKGVHASWSPYSATQAVHVYAEPSVGLALTAGGADVEGDATAFPLRIVAQLPAYVAANHAVAWWAEVVAAESYPTVGRDGSPVTVSEGERLWHVDMPADSGTEVPSEGDACNRVCIAVAVGADALRMEPNVSYVARAGCATSAGLRGEDGAAFAWAPSGEVGQPGATLDYDPETLGMVVSVSCVDEDEQPTGATLAVWRVESGGSTVLVADGLAHGGTCVDPHPDFGDCAYRVVATDPATGLQDAMDVATHVPETAVVVQWGERWDVADEADEVAPGVLSYAGERVRLPFELSLSEEREADMAEVAYLDRRRPVLYVGRALRQECSASGVIDESEDPGIHWRIRAMLEAGGPVYVREPSGTGFWASVRGTVTPSGPGTSAVSLRFVRVEG